MALLDLTQALLGHIGIDESVASADGSIEIVVDEDVVVEITAVPESDGFFVMAKVGEISNREDTALLRQLLVANFGAGLSHGAMLSINEELAQVHLCRNFVNAELSAETLAEALEAFMAVLFHWRGRLNGQSEGKGENDAGDPSSQLPPRDGMRV